MREVSAAGPNYTLLLEGSGLNMLGDPPEHSHVCPECREAWAHRDEECSNDAIPDPWYRGATTGGYAACPDCGAPGSNGSEWVFCPRCLTHVLADPAGEPGCGCVGFVQDPTRGWAVAL